MTDGLSIECASDYTPKKDDADYLKSNDVPWIKRFHDAGGQVIISGNTKMKSVPHERLALVDCGMIVIFFDPSWNNLKFYPKCARLLHWWPAVVQTIKAAPNPSFWHIPSNLGDADRLRQVSHDDQKKLKLERQLAAAPKKVAERRRRRSKSVHPLQTSMELDKELPK